MNNGILTGEIIFSESTQPKESITLISDDGKGLVFFKISAFAFSAEIIYLILRQRWKYYKGNERNNSYTISAKILIKHILESQLMEMKANLE